MSSRYQPQLPTWKQDLAKSSGLGFISNINYIAYANDNYCEVYRKREIGEACVAFGLFLFFYIAFIFATISMLFPPISIGVFIFALLCLFPINVVGCYVFFHFLRAYYAPASSPIRFNRQTGKVYFYENVAMKYGLQFRIPLKAFKDLKKYEIKVYDWQNVEGILLGATRVLNAGGTSDSHYLMCVGCKPNSDDVIDRFFISRTDEYGTAWNWISNFMQYRLEKPIDQNGLKYIAYNSEDKQSFADIEPRRKLTSRQIEGLDKASKASSKEELTQIELEYQLDKTVYPVY
ncbi:DUF6708 domain-containing protein [Orbus mooreae]|uniref:DUF6708 domain-containing protein n=1 Tax=Orbus mooreae TaxID=3074107 RepID=UPI00370DAB1E